MRILIGILAVCALSGCITPTLSMANENGGVLHHVNGPTRQQAFEIATAHCAQYGRTMRVTSTDALDAALTFECVES